MNKSSGFSLIELIVVIALIGILLSIATMAFNSWQRNARVEGQVKEMLSDFNNVRLMAMQTKRAHRLFLNPLAYSVVRYEDELDQPRVDDTAGGQVVTSKGDVVANRQNAKQLRFVVQSYTNGVVAPLANRFVEFDERGLTQNRVTLAVDFGLSDPAYNCIVINDARINIGRINNATNACVFK